MLHGLANFKCVKMYAR